MLPPPIPLPPPPPPHRFAGPGPVEPLLLLPPRVLFVLLENDLLLTLALPGPEADPLLLRVALRFPPNLGFL
jgi:hypothetical protein